MCNCCSCIKNCRISANSLDSTKYKIQKWAKAVDAGRSQGSEWSVLAGANEWPEQEGLLGAGHGLFLHPGVAYICVLGL